MRQESRQTTEKRKKLIARVKSLHETGLSTKEIATKLGKTKRTVQQAKTVLGVGNPKGNQPRVHPADALIIAGKSNNAVATILGCSIAVVKNRRTLLARVGTVQVRAYNPGNNRVSPVTFPQSDSYVAGVEADLHDLHEAHFPNLSYQDFKEGLKTPSGQRFLATMQREALVDLPVMSMARPPMSRHTSGGYGSMTA